VKFICPPFFLGQSFQFSGTTAHIHPANTSGIHALELGIGAYRAAVRASIKSELVPSKEEGATFECGLTASVQF